jgi:CheY-like chemotaxis protein
MSRRILVVCDDILFWARIRAAADGMGLAVTRVTDAAALEAEMAEGGIGQVLADLDARSIDALSVAARFLALPDRPELVAFGSHVDEETLERARRAGYDQVVPNSVLHRRVGEILRSS